MARIFVGRNSVIRNSVAYKTIALKYFLTDVAFCIGFVFEVGVASQIGVMSEAGVASWSRRCVFVGVVCEACLVVCIDGPF